MTTAANPRRLRRVVPAFSALALLALLAASAWMLARDRDPDRLSALAASALEQGRLEQADRLLDRLAALRAPTADDWALRALLAFNRGDDDDGLEAASHIPDDHRMAAWARTRAGQVEVRRHRFRAAEDQFRRALEIDPSLVEPRRELLYIQGIYQRPDAIEAQFRALDELVPLEFRDVWYWCVARNNLSWEVEENLDVLDEILRADPGDDRARLVKAQVLMTSGASADRIRELVEPLGEDDPDVIALRSRLAIDRGDLAEASRLLDLGPDRHAELALIRGRLALRQHGPEAAIPHFRLAFDLDPHLRETGLALGQALRAAGKPDEARPFLEHASATDALSGLLQRSGTSIGKDDPELLSRLGDACLRAGRLPEARAWFELELARDPFDDEVQATLSRIDHLISEGAGGPPPAG